jgi:hypothetical protein
MAGVVGLAQAIKNGPEYGKAGKCYVVAIEEITNPLAGMTTREFPWPENLSMSRNATYADTSMPGGTHAVHNWTGTEGWGFSLVFKLFRDIRPSSELPGLTSLVVHPTAYENQKYNRDVQYDIDYLHQFVLPTYEESSGYTIPKAPPHLMLVCEGVSFNMGANYLVAVVKTIEVDISRRFPSGIPRAATVTLTCEEVMYDPYGNVVLHDRKNLNLQRMPI